MLNLTALNELSKKTACTYKSASTSLITNKQNEPELLMAQLNTPRSKLTGYLREEI